MKQLRSWAIAISLMVGWSQAQAFELMSHRWDDPYIEVCFNPEHLPETFAQNDPAMIEILSSEARRELQIQIFEEAIDKAAHTLSRDAEHRVVISYIGLTSESCEGWYTNGAVVRLEPDHRHQATGGVLVKDWSNNTLAGRVTYDANARIFDARYVRNFMHVTLVHELGHVLGLYHEDDVLAVMNSRIYSAMTPLYDDDIAGLQHLYALEEDCASTIDMVNGRLSFEVQVYLDGRLYRGRLDHHYDGERDTLVINRLYENPYGEGKFCPVKVVDGELNIPYIWYLGELHYLNAELQDDGAIEIVDYGLVQ